MWEELGKLQNCNQNTVHEKYIFNKIWEKEKRGEY